MEYLEFDLTPYYESCANLGEEDYYERTRIEYNALRNQLIRMFGEIPDGVLFMFASCPHDFGTYHELRIKYVENIKNAREYVYGIEENFPHEWDDISLEYLRESKYFTEAHPEKIKPKLEDTTF